MIGKKLLMIGEEAGLPIFLICKQYIWLLPQKMLTCTVKRQIKHIQKHAKSFCLVHTTGNSMNTFLTNVINDKTNLHEVLWRPT